MKNKETLEEAAENESEYLSDWEDKDMYQRGFIAGAKWQQERSYSEQEVLELFNQHKKRFIMYRNMQILDVEFNKWFEQFKNK
jgi:hypothetical protein